MKIIENEVLITLTSTTLALLLKDLKRVSRRECSTCKCMQEGKLLIMPGNDSILRRS